jgi:hypothetical protein
LCHSSVFHRTFAMCCSRSATSGPGSKADLRRTKESEWQSERCLARAVIPMLRSQYWSRGNAYTAGLSTEKYFPTRVTPPDSPWCRVGGHLQRTVDRNPLVEKWTISTNGWWISGMHASPALVWDPAINLGPCTQQSSNLASQFRCRFLAGWSIPREMSYQSRIAV